MSGIRLFFVIPNFNRRYVLARTLPSLLAQDFPPDNYEVIVGSSTGLR